MMRPKRTVILLLMGIVACSGEQSTRETITVPVVPPSPAPKVVAMVAITPSTVSALRAGTSVQLVAVARDADGGPLARTFTWSSSDPNVASVSGSGVVTAAAVGRTMITATTDGIRANVTIEVGAAVASLQMSPRLPPPLVPGDTLSLRATVRDSTGTVLADRPVSYRALTPAIATISTSGLITALAIGTASFAAESEGITATTSVIVRPPVASTRVSPLTPTLFPGENRAIRSFALDAQGSILEGRRADWSSSDPSVVQVTSTLEGAALLVAIAPGSATIGVTIEGKRATTLVTVRRLTASISLTPIVTSLELGRRQQLSATVRDDLGAILHGVQVKWSSSEPAVAMVSSDGVITSVGLGSTTIAAEADGVRTTVNIHTTPLSLRMRTLVAGFTHSCALTTSGETFCWGDNSGGRIGSGDWSLIHTTPVQVVGGLRFLSLSAGGSHTCGLTADGMAYCWGSNWRGSLGIASSQNSRNSPVPVSTNRRFVQVTGGQEHTCGLEADGVVWCWGRNDRGQLGDGSTIDRNEPIAVKTSQRFVDIAAAFSHTCGVTAAAEAWCWGNNNQGQLGQGTQGGDKFVPIRVKRDAPFTQIAANGNASCALTRESVAYCWGDNSFGILGTGRGQNLLLPVPVPGVMLTSIELGMSHVCGTTAAKLMLCWGNGGNAQLGTGNLESGQAPAAPAGIGAIRTFAMGRGHSCAAVESGGIRCWGMNEFAQLGIGTQSRSVEPVLVPDITGARAIVAGGYFSCALTRANATYCWGDNSSRQLADGTTSTRLRPTRSDGRSYTDIAAMYAGVCGLQTDGQVVCWGNDQAPAIVDTPMRFREIASSSRSYHWCGITTIGRAACAGGNWQGQLGNGGMDYHPGPVLVAVDEAFSRVQAGGTHSCGITESGISYCWGNNADGQLGMGSRGVSQPIPIRVSTRERFRMIAPGPWDTCALNSSGTAFCWGADYYGKVGDGPSAGPVATPSTVLGNLQFASIAMGHDHVCGLTAAGSLYCWGGNQFGQFGSGDTMGTDGVPRPSGLGYRWLAVAAGTTHTCGIALDERVYCWGDNSYGAVGQSFPTTPQAVVGNLTVANER